jgi:hypothetical protein
MMNSVVRDTQNNRESVFKLNRMKGLSAEIGYERERRVEDRMHVAGGGKETFFALN